MMRIIIASLITGMCITVSGQTIDEAKTHLYYQRFSSAKKVLTENLKSSGQSPDTWYWLGEIYLKEGKRDSASAAFMSAASLYLNNNYSKKDYPLAPIGWAHLLMDSGLLSAARSQMEEMAVLTKYKNPEVLLAIANANIESKHGDKKWAIELLEKAAKRDKKNPEIFLAMGDAYTSLIDGSNAIRYYDRALDINPLLAEALYKKGLIYKTQNNTEIYLDRFSKAVEADSTYAPALYELYSHYFYRDLKKAGELLSAYIRHSDPTPEHSYMLVDYHFVSNNYDRAIEGAKKIIELFSENAKPRLYKLIAYSYAAQSDSVSAEKAMQAYFSKQQKNDCVAKDYQLMAMLTESVYEDKSKAIPWYRNAIAAENSFKDKLNYMISLAEIQKDLGNREREAAWREKIFNVKEQPTNLDIYNWGIALFMSEDYSKADSVFGLYAARYPNQIYGHLWQARCNAIIDSAMEQGTAVQYYQKVIEIAAQDSIKNKAALLKAYNYLGIYEANRTKDYPASLSYFEKMLALDPENTEAIKYRETVKSWIGRDTSRK